MTKGTQENSQGFLFSYDYQSDPNKIDFYKYEQQTMTPPSSPLPASSFESFSPSRNKKNDENILTYIKEIDEWNLLWKEIVELMTEITQFPSFLIQNSNDQRRSLLILAQNICQIAKNPKESEEYKDLLKENEMKDKKILELQNENSELNNEIENLKLLQKDELSSLTSKIQQMENYALQIEHYTFQVDKRKEAAQASFQRYSSKPNLHTQQPETKENNEQQKRINYPIKSEVNTNTKKNNVKKNHNKKVKRKTSPKNNKAESSNSDSPNKKTNIFRIEENQRFEEDYISKLIQKYTKPDDSNQNVQQNDFSEMHSLFNRSLKPIEDRAPKNISKRGRKRRAWH